ncbi:MAG: DUF1844 domain-containing protein [Candidatus Sumerlaeaceae bacterium]|nr:DUF1844 domain-containing protein [Candidatus Sumerlaeaceae bacterium]
MGQTLLRPQFVLLVQQHLTQALLLCTESKKKGENLELAQLQISLLEVIEETTRGNLSADEEKLLADALHEARMAYVMAKQHKPQHVEEKSKDVPAETAGSSASAD